MSTTYHPEGNRDFRRWMESGVPTTALMGAQALSMYGTNKFDLWGSNKNLASSLMNQSIQKDPRLKISNFTPRKSYYPRFNIPKWTDTMWAHYNPKSHTVNVPRGNYGILAHELGHAEQYKNPLYKKTIAPLSRVGRMAGQLGGLAPILSDNEEDARRNSIVAGAMQVPTLIEEIDASRRGSNILNKHISKNPAFKSIKGTSRMAQALTRLRPFAGIPSYLLGAAAPYLVYKYMKNRGLYEGEY